MHAGSKNLKSTKRDIGNYRHLIKRIEEEKEKMRTMIKRNRLHSASPSLLLVLSLSLSSSTKVNALISTQPPRPSSTIPLVEPKMPMNWPIVGTLPDFIARGGVDGLREVHESMYKDFGNVYGMSIIGDDELIVCDPRVYKEYVSKNEGRFPVGGAEGVTTFIDYYKENDLKFAQQSVSRGPEWKEWRQTLNKDMFVYWDTYLPSIAETCKFASSVAGDQVNNGKLRFEDFISRLAFDMFSTVLYGTSPNTVDTDNTDKQNAKFVVETQNAFTQTGALLMDPLAKVFESDKYLSFKKSMDFTFQLGAERTMEFIDKAREEQATNTIDTIDGADGATAAESKCPIQKIKSVASKKLNPSFIDRLVSNNELTKEQMGEITGLLLMAGVDTTAFVMSWLYLNLATNPEVQTKLAKELETVLQGSDLTSADQLDELPYLRACIRESHRLTPAAPLASKKLEKDIDVVVDNKKYRVKGGNRISLNLRAFPMDPQYVDNPKQYQPERFLPDAIKARKGTPSEIIDHKYFEDPFGYGKRKCLGGNVAYAEIYASVARLIQDWEIQLKPGLKQEWKPKQTLMLKANPYPEMVLAPRK